MLPPRLRLKRQVIRRSHSASVKARGFRLHIFRHATSPAAIKVAARLSPSAYARHDTPYVTPAPCRFFAMPFIAYSRVLIHGAQFSSLPYAATPSPPRIFLLPDRRRLARVFFAAAAPLEGVSFRRHPHIFIAHAAASSFSST